MGTPDGPRREVARRDRGQIREAPPENGQRPSARRRLAAVLALAGLLGALLAVSFAIVRGDAWRLPLVLIGGAAAVVGLWFALSRRGAASLAGLVVAAAGLVLLVLVIVLADYRGIPFAVAIALILLSAAASRSALGPDQSGARPSAEVMPRPRQPVLIMNPKSGGGKAEKFRLEEECRSRGIEPIVLRPGDDLLELARDAIARGADVIGMAGGDGSQALVATVAAAHDIPHVCVPAGTRNHFALDLGLDREDVVGALDAFLEGVERRVDLAQVNGRVFVNNACMGLYAKIVQSPGYREAKMKTAADMLPDLIGPNATPFDLRFEGPDGTAVPTAHLLLVSNDPYQLDHLAGRGTRAHMDLGTLGVVAARIASPREAVTFVGLEAAGRIRSFQGWQEWNTPHFEVDSGAPVEIGIDGEALVMDPPLVFETRPAALRVRIPQHALGLSPAALAVRLSRSSVGALVSIAVGRSPVSR